MPKFLLSLTEENYYYYYYYYFYIPSFKRNSEEKLKTNIARIDKDKILDFDAEISKPV